MTEKTCTTCGETKALDAFYASKRGRYGRASQCKVCDRAAARARYFAQRDKQRAALANGRAAIAEQAAYWRSADLPDAPHPARYKELDDLKALASVLDGAVALKRAGWRPVVEETASLEEW